MRDAAVVDAIFTPWQVTFTDFLRAPAAAMERPFSLSVKIASAETDPA
jgi:hypothetical protein